MVATKAGKLKINYLSNEVAIRAAVLLKTPAEKDAQ